MTAEWLPADVIAEFLRVERLVKHPEQWVIRRLRKGGLGGAKDRGVWYGRESAFELAYMATDQNGDVLDPIIGKFYQTLLCRGLLKGYG